MAYMPNKNQADLAKFNIENSNSYINSDLYQKSQINSAIVKKFLRGTHYPSQKRNLIEVANNDKASLSVLGASIRGKNGKCYSTIDVFNKVGRLSIN